MREARPIHQIAEKRARKQRLRKKPADRKTDEDREAACKEPCADSSDRMSPQLQPVRGARRRGAFKRAVTEHSKPRIISAARNLHLTINPCHIDQARAICPSGQWSSNPAPVAALPAPRPRLAPAAPHGG